MPAASCHRQRTVGTLGGYSAIWLARALAPGGKLITLEADEKHATVARQNIAAADLELSSEDVRDIDAAAARIPVQGARYPEQLQRMVRR